MSKYISGPQIQLRSGKYFSLESMNVEDIELIDIATSLSNLCRFNGHCIDYYSVAQHCCICSDNAPEGYKWDALMHDCVESVVGDIARPIKYAIPGFKELEKSIEVPMYQHNMVLNSGVIKELDLKALATEKRDLMPDTGDTWVVIEKVEPWKEKIIPWQAVIATDEFMKRAVALDPR